MHKQRLVLIGGGHTHALVARQWAMQPRPDTEVVLVSDCSLAPYSGMLPGFIAGYYSRELVHIDLRRLAQAAGAVFIEARVEGLDPKAQLVHLQGRPALHYDVASINVGITPTRATVPGAEEWAVPIKPVRAFIQHWQTLLANAATAKAPQRIIIVGGGSGGVEVALAMRHRLGAAAEITMVQGATSLTPNHPRRVQERLRIELERQGVRLYLHTKATTVAQDALTLSSGVTLPFDALYWTTQAQAPAWFAATGLELAPRGYLATDATLACTGQSRLFAVGDCATIIGHERPKAGVFAVRQGPWLMANLQRALDGRTLKSVRLQKKYLALLALGEQRALATKGAMSLSGAWAWRWKDRIDRGFMEKFSALPAAPTMMAERTGAAPARDDANADANANADAMAMRCLGCGSKVGGTVLSAALNALRQAAPDIASHAGLDWGLAEREDVCLWTPPPRTAVVQSLDFLPALIDDAFVAGQIACNHAFNDLIAKGAEPHSALLLAILPVAAEPLVADHLRQALAGVAAQLRLLGAALTGGHTSEGERLAIGLAVNGLATRELVAKTSGRDGDDLILTKALGTGVIFAAARQGLAGAAEVDAALASMVASQHALLDLLRLPTVHAATDVSGFGLLGHLQEMLTPGTLHAELSAASLPYLPGAEALAKRGVTSSLQPANRRLVVDNVRAAAGDAWSLWCDPQTSGGLLLSVAPASTPAVITQLQALGFPAACRIGGLRPRGAGEVAIAIC